MISANEPTICSGVLSQRSLVPQDTIIALKEAKVMSPFSQMEIKSRAYDPGTDWTLTYVIFFKQKTAYEIVM
jgi:hypothetical protein